MRTRQPAGPPLRDSARRTQASHGPWPLALPHKEFYYGVSIYGTSLISFQIWKRPGSMMAVSHRSSLFNSYEADSGEVIDRDTRLQAE